MTEAAIPIENSVVQFDKLPGLTPLHRLNPHTIRLMPETYYGGELTRILDYDSAPELKYDPTPNDSKTIIQWGQRKLLMCELEFLTIVFEHLERETVLYDAQGNVLRPLLVYAGIVTGQHHPIMHQYFHNIDWVMVDPNIFNFIIDNVHTDDLEFVNKRGEYPATDKHGRIVIINDYMTEELAHSIKKEFADRTIIFLADTRTNPGRGDNMELYIRHDQQLQDKVCEILNPFMSMLKFRMPFYHENGVDEEHFVGKIFTQTRMGASSSETRLIFRGIPSQKRIYNHYRFEDMMAHFNQVERMCLYHHGLNEPGFDMCHDCAREAQVWARIIQMQLCHGGDVLSPQTFITPYSGSPAQNAKRATEIMEYGDAHHSRAIRFQGMYFCTEFANPTVWTECTYIRSRNIDVIFERNPDMASGGMISGGNARPPLRLPAAILDPAYVAPSPVEQARAFLGLTNINALHRENPHTLRLQPATFFAPHYSRTIDLPHAPRRAYSKRPPTKTILHWGQFKLLLTELEFLSIAYEHLYKENKLYIKNGDETSILRPLVVYMGAAGGHHHPFLHQFYNKVDWVLIDPNAFAFEMDGRRASLLKYDENRRAEYPASDKHGRVIIYNKLFSLELAQAIKDEFPDRTILFLSDIRSGTGDMPPPEFEKRVVADSILQKGGSDILKPYLSMLKFRTPYFFSIQEMFLPYTPGQIYPQTRQGPTSTETRLIYRGTPQATVNYGYAAFENVLYYFNEVTRMQLYQHGLSGPGFDMCYDCATEAYIWGRVIQQQHLFNHIAPLVTPPAPPTTAVISITDATLPEKIKPVKLSPITAFTLSGDTWSAKITKSLETGQDARPRFLRYQGRDLCSNFTTPSLWYNCTIVRDIKTYDDDDEGEAYGGGIGYMNDPPWFTPNDEVDGGTMSSRLLRSIHDNPPWFNEQDEDHVELLSRHFVSKVGAFGDPHNPEDNVTVMRNDIIRGGSRDTNSTAIVTIATSPGDFKGAMVLAASISEHMPMVDFVCLANTHAFKHHIGEPQIADLFKQTDYKRVIYIPINSVIVGDCSDLLRVAMPAGVVKEGGLYPPFVINPRDKKFDMAKITGTPNELLSAFRNIHALPQIYNKESSSHSKLIHFGDKRPWEQERNAQNAAWWKVYNDIY